MGDTRKMAIPLEASYLTRCVDISIHLKEVSCVHRVIIHTIVVQSVPLVNKAPPGLWVQLD